MAGPFKIEGKPYTITAEGKALIAAGEGEPRTGKIEPLAATGEESVESKNWVAVLATGIIAVAAAGLAISRKKATT